MHVVPVADPADPRLTDFTDLTDIDLRSAREPAEGLFLAEGEKVVLRAQGEAQAIQKVFDAIHAGGADEQVLAYQYIQALPTIANGTANKVWVVPAELTTAMANLGNAFRTPAPERPAEIEDAGATAAHERPAEG